jgi:hypothetical protein
MSKKVENPIISLSAFDIVLYLVILPFCFTGTMHVISSQSDELFLSESTRFIGDMSAARSYLLDMEKVKSHLLFRLTPDKYTKFAQTNHHFNYSLPILGQRLMKVIRIKEELSYNEESDKIETVNSGNNSTNTFSG